MGDASSATPVVKTGDTVEGRYRIVAPLDEGGMGTVFLAEHVLIKRRVALKVLRPEHATDADVIERFMNEARAAGTLGHPNIVESTDMGFTRDGVPYIVFEYLEGSLLTDEIYRVGGMPVRRAVRIARQIASALSAAHNAGIVHRDMKSDNVFLTHKEEASDHVKVLDFGISQFQGVDDNANGKGGQVMGTPQFMAPEQVTAPDKVDRRADIYALGVIIYEMLTARRPFKNDEDPEALLQAIVKEPPPSLDLPGAPPGLEEMLFTKLLAKNPDERYQSMKDVEGALEAFAGVLRNGQRDSAPIPVATPPEELANVTPMAAKVIALPQPRKPRSPIGWLLGALLAGGAGVAVMLAAPGQAAATDQSAAATAALQGDAEKIGSTFDNELRAVKLRVDGIAQTPMLRAGIETDAATVKDMVGSDFLYQATKGEVLEIFQLKDGGGAPSSMMRIPESAPALKPPEIGQARLESDGKHLLVVVAAPVTKQRGGTGGMLVLSAPIDLGPFEAALKARVIEASLVGVGLPVVLAHGDKPAGPTTSVSVPIPVTKDLHVSALSLGATVATPPPPAPSSTLPLVRDACWGVGGILALIFAVSLLRRQRQG